MGWLSGLFEGAQPARAARWVVVDCETSGLDAARDSLIAIGAVAIADSRIAPAECFEAVLAQRSPSAPANILVHGIGAGRQLAGQPPQTALAALAGFAGEAPCVAFHAPFDQAMLTRAARKAGVRAPRRWLDLARLAPLVFPRKAPDDAPLEQWLAVFGIHHGARHDALGDAYASAQLFLVVLAEAARQGFGSVRAVMGAQRAGRWAPR